MHSAYHSSCRLPTELVSVTILQKHLQSGSALEVPQQGQHECQSAAAQAVAVCCYLLLTYTLAAQAHDVGAFQTSPLITTSCSQQQVLVGPSLQPTLTYSWSELVKQ